MLLDLVREWVGIMNDAFADPRMTEIRSNLANTYFAWSGPTTNGSAAYFRVQGPTLVVEYAPQNSVDHIHTIYRDPTNDYGASTRANNAIALAVAAALTVVCTADASAHRLDEYLQAARIGVAVNRIEVELDVTPGVAVADAVVNDIDADRDGILSSDEQQAYAQRVSRAIELWVDNDRVQTTLISSRFPITIELQTDGPPLTGGRHLIRFRNANTPASAAYLANALLPDDDRVSISRQSRDPAQQELTIDVDVRGVRALTARETLYLSLTAAAFALLAIVRAGVRRHSRPEYP